MEVIVSKGWELYAHDYFIERLQKLIETVEKLAEQDPSGFFDHSDYKFFDRVTNAIYEDVPSDPQHDKFLLGNTLGRDHKHWKRIKSGLPDRYRLFFQFRSSSPRAIIYVWLNDQRTLRKDGDKKDVYTVFKKMLTREEVPDTWDELLEAAGALPQLAPA